MSEELSPEQIAHRKIMDEVNAAYKATPIDPQNAKLKLFIEKLKARGFNFDPFKVIKLLDIEANRQHEELVSEFFKGQHTDVIASAKDEIIKWYYEEEERFAVFKEVYLKGPEEVLSHAEDVWPAKILDEVDPGDLPKKIVKINRKKK